jgi:hypothetical protein
MADDRRRHPNQANGFPCRCPACAEARRRRLARLAEAAIAKHRALGQEAPAALLALAAAMADHARPACPPAAPGARPQG